MYNFLHKYKLTISRPPQINENPETITPEDGSVQVVEKDGDYRTVDSLEAIEITDLSFKGNFNASNTKNSKSAFSFTLKGFRPQTESFVEKNSIVILEAGYENSLLSVIFVGQVYDKEVDNSQEVPVMKVMCTEGYTPSNSVKVTKEFPAATDGSPAVTYQDILLYLSGLYSDNGIPIGREIDLLTNKVGQGMTLGIDEIELIDGYTIQSSYLDSALSKVCKEVGFTYYFNKGRLYIEPQNYQSELVEQFTITPQQVLSINKIIPKGALNSKDTQEASAGYRLKIFLDGRLDVGDLIDLRLDNLNGTFKVKSLEFDMDYEGDSWYTIAEIQNV